ncbi:MAG: tyrosine--tRNA ligase [Oscillospiraceae bacterium]
MNIFNELLERGLVAQCTNEEKAKELLDCGNITFYIGFDATADSLHVGHFLQLIIISRLQKAGNKPIILLGGGTTMVGDPTGKTDMRKMLTVDEIDYNVNCFKKQMSKIVDIDNITFVNNADWLLKLNYVDLLKNIGVHFSVNRMLSAECFKSRYERGLSFIEFNYMIMQSYDFLELYKNYDCQMQLGGNDQWSNILGGVDLIRRINSKEVVGLTFTLLTTKDGKKMGKTEKGAVWLDPDKTSPYDFYQYWRNIDDADVLNCMKMLTFLTIEDIDFFEKNEDINKCKEILAFELTKQVHGLDNADKSRETAKNIFSGNINTENMPFYKLDDSHFIDNLININDILFLSGLSKSKSEARKLIEQGGVSIDNIKITDIKYNINMEDIRKQGYIIIKKGKKVFYKITL